MASDVSAVWAGRAEAQRAQASLSTTLLKIDANVVPRGALAWAFALRRGI